MHDVIETGESAHENICAGQRSAAGQGSVEGLEEDADARRKETPFWILDR